MMLDAAGFFGARFSGLGEHERIHLRALDRHGQVRQGWYRTADDAASAALRLASRANVYYGVNPRRDGDGTKAGVTCLLALHEDVDLKHYGGSERDAWAALGTFPLPPSLVVHSGGGLQPTWFLSVPIAGDDREGITRAEAIMQRLGDRLGRLDATHDVSRIFRVPGTWNHKYDPPRPVEVVEFDPARRYTLDQFEELLPAPPPLPCPSWSPSTTRARPDVPSPAEIREMLRYVPPRGDYLDDWLRVLAAIHSAYPGPEGVALAEEWSPGYPGEIARKFASFGRYKGQNGPATIGTLIHLARRHGWRPASATPPPFEYRRGQVVR